MDKLSFFRYCHLATDKQIAVIVFMICIALRIAPELQAYPYPIGYDVVNYYIPKVVNFHQQWGEISKQFPLYVILLYSLSAASMLPASVVVTSVAVAIAGVFGLSLFYIGRTLLNLRIIQSLFLAIFTVFQMSVLRTFWDLHRDVLALAAMLFVFSLLGKREMSWKVLSIALTLTAITVAADRMIGALFCLSIVTYFIITRRKEVALTAVVAISLFSIIMVASHQLSYTNANINTSEASKSDTPNFYSQRNLLAYFLVANCLVVVPAAVGFLRMHNSLLKIPLIISLAGSFSWLIFSENNLFAPDRWIILTSIFFSIFAGFGILYLVNKLQPNLSVIVACLILTPYIVIGLAYALMPYDTPFVLYSVLQNYIMNFAPASMQFNSVDIEDNDNLFSVIEEINENTDHNAIIVGSPHFRGFMELYLKDDRIYHYSNDPRGLATSLEEQGYAVYLIVAEGDPQTTFRIENVQKR